MLVSNACLDKHVPLLLDNTCRQDLRSSNPAFLFVRKTSWRAKAPLHKAVECCPSGGQDGGHFCHLNMT